MLQATEETRRRECGDAGAQAEPSQWDSDNTGAEPSRTRARPPPTLDTFPEHRRNQPARLGPSRVRRRASATGVAVYLCRPWG
ncbi:hypothetical protein Pflav_073420 [Phytohabitans flavus]|uniref:Uncharacterized protein n=1 Tax=Phytohabitans flavus TaxID=1076124 RepID=A0A6F8Y492_9ACTN|nr:hypothetical protein Pflav_073420 [Phytohabitans flavus]